MALEISNGTTVPHATDYSDLLTKLKNFAVAQGWVVMGEVGSDLFLKGVGNAGTDAIYVGIRKWADALNDTYGWELSGFTGYNAGIDYWSQPGAPVVGATPVMPLWNSTIPYWFIVNKRRIIVIAKVSATYQACYLGFITPFCPPSMYPYPLCIGGTGNEYLQRYSSANCSMFIYSPNVSGTPGTTAILRHQDGVWYEMKNGGGDSYTTYGTAFGMWSLDSWNGLLKPNLDGSYPILPAWIATRRSGNGQYYYDLLGEFDGCYYTSGYTNSAENTITVGGRTFVVIPDVYRSGTGSYLAFELA
jgi:hypothetical protein